jgi:YVTN family beta-propeller protein
MIEEQVQGTPKKAVILSGAQRSRKPALSPPKGTCFSTPSRAEKLRAPFLRLFPAARVGSKRPALGILALVAIALTLTACRSHDFSQYPPNSREYAYITNGDSGTVSVLDVVNVRLDRELTVGQNPVAVAVNPTRNEVYVLNSGARDAQGSVSVINAENNTVAATIPVQRQPLSIDLDTTGSLAYVANSGSNTISVLDLKARREIARIGTGEAPASVRLTSDRKTLVVANSRSASVSIIDPATGNIRAAFDNCPGAGDTVILPDSTKAFIACATGHQVMVIALAHSKSNPDQPDRLETLMDVGHAPVHLALKPDGGELFASNSLSGSISEIYASTDEVGGAYLMGDDPVRGLVSNDNAMLYVANFRSQWVTVYSIDDGKRVAAIHVGDGPAAMAFSGDGHLLFVVDTRSGDVAVVRTSSNSLFTLFSTGRSPNAIAIKAFKVQ